MNVEVTFKDKKHKNSLKMRNKTLLTVLSSADAC